MTWKLVGAAAMALAVAACGTQPGERTTGGAAAGAATGAGIGALGGPVGALAGAAIGAGAGAVTGAATSPSQVNLGAPPWDNPRARIPGIEEGSSGTQYSANEGQYRPYGASRQYGSSERQHSSRTVRRAQRALQQRGFNPGSIDGIYGPQTASAIEDFQRANNMQADGQLDNQVLQALNVNRSGNNSATRTGSSNRSGNASSGGSGSNMNNTGYSGTNNAGTNNSGMNNPGVNSTNSTGPGGTTGTGSGNQPGTGGTSQQSR